LLKLRGNYVKEKEIGRLVKGEGKLSKKSSPTDIASFLKVARQIEPGQSGRLIFALDATMSRQPTWDRAMTIQASMFDAVGKAGGLSVQLIYFRGIEECRASKWVINAEALRNLMLGIRCLAGHTQIEKVLTHADRETTAKPVSALVYIGDAIEEPIDYLCRKAGELGLKGVRCFFFQEGEDSTVESGFREMARLTRGAYFRLGSDSARELAELLRAVATYVKGGLKALSNHSSREARLLLEQMK